MTDADEGFDPVDKAFFRYSRWAAFGINWVVTSVVYVFLGFYGGRWIDDRLATGPLFLVLGLLGGVGMSLWGLLSSVASFAASEEKRRGSAPPSGKDRERDNFPDDPER